MCITCHNRVVNGWFIYNGLDRIDSSLRHNKDNVVPCCSVCNTAKLDLTVEEFYNWIDRVVERKTRHDFNRQQSTSLKSASSFAS
jgi:hypothetical protein